MAMLIDHRKGVKSKNCIWLSMLVAILSVVVVSCTKDVIDAGGSSVTPDGKVLISLSVKVPVPDQVQTRATAEQEDQINSLDIVVFDADNKLSQSSASAIFNATSWKVALVPNPALQNIYAIANLAAWQRTALEGLPVGTTFDDVRAALAASDVTSAGVSHPFMMLSHVIQTAVSPTMGVKQVEMTRAVTRIDVIVSGALTPDDFQLESVTLLNAAKKYNPIPATLPALFTGADAIRYNEVKASDNSVASAIYCYENSSIADYPTQLLIKGRYKGATTSGYYKLNIMYEKAGVYYFDIKRNFTYTVNITNVNNSGYSTEQEALTATPSNGMETEIVITDADARDILSNGTYYIGFSNSECIIYTSEAHNDELIATFSHNAPNWIGQGSVSVQGTGLTLSGSNPFSTPNGSVQTGDIKVNIGANFVSGNVIVKLGNLEKRISITRDATPLSYGGPFNLGDTYIYAKKLQTGANTDWIKLSPDADASVGDDELDNPGGSIHMQLGVNLKLLGGTDRTCDLICARKNHEGRVRVKVAQYAFDIFEYDGQINNTYVGTFHRWNQVGERVITMVNPGSIWVATVVAGGDFITLAHGGSEDPAFGTDSPGDAESYPVHGNIRTLINTTPGAPILFRVGLKTPLQSADAQPRYGLILVTHAGGTNRIFVRHGEAPDYIMRKSDKMESPASITRSDRPFAVRFSPFHLTDPARTSGQVDLSGNGGVFVQYPSIGGYHFQANNNIGWSPELPTVSGWNPSAPYMAGNPCPLGYRRPFDGVAAGNNGFVDGSEMRQSLWFYPQNGAGSSDYYNTIRGALADGYYDRLSKNESTVNPKFQAITAGSGIDKAFIGTIIFNPFTNASVFMPAAGLRNYNTGNMFDQGKNAIWWSQSKAGYGYWFASMEYFNDNFTFDNYSTGSSNGFSVRCVTEVNP